MCSGLSLPSLPVCLAAGLLAWADLASRVLCWASSPALSSSFLALPVLSLLLPGGGWRRPGLGVSCVGGLSCLIYSGLSCAMLASSLEWPGLRLLFPWPGLRQIVQSSISNFLMQRQPNAFPVTLSSYSYQRHVGPSNSGMLLWFNILFMRIVY